MRRLPRDASTTSTAPDRPRGLVAGWVLRPRARRRSRAARSRRHLRRQPQLGRGSRSTGSSARREPGPALLGHLLWVCGLDDIETFIEAAEDVHLDGIVEQITVRVPDHHGQQRPPDPRRYAHQSSPGRRRPNHELRIFTPEEVRPSTSAPRPPAARRRVHRGLDRGPASTAGVFLMVVPRLVAGAPHTSRPPIDGRGYRRQARPRTIAREAMTLTGRVVLITGTAGGIGAAAASLFAKGGVVAMTKRLAQQGAAVRHRVDCVTPAWSRRGHPRHLLADDQPDARHSPAPSRWAGRHAAEVAGKAALPRERRRRPT